jgi:hypothetical protein
VGFALAGKNVSFSNSNVKFITIHKNGLDRSLEFSGQQPEGVCFVAGAKEAETAVFGYAAYNPSDTGLVGWYDCKKDMVCAKQGRLRPYRYVFRWVGFIDKIVNKHDFYGVKR